MVARAADDGRYWYLFAVSDAQVGMWFLQWDHVFVLLAAVLLCYWLALHLTEPVRQMQRAVERFGRGENVVRVRPGRIGERWQLRSAVKRRRGKFFDEVRDPMRGDAR